MNRFNYYFVMNSVIITVELIVGRFGFISSAALGGHRRRIANKSCKKILLTFKVTAW